MYILIILIILLLIIVNLLKKLKKAKEQQAIWKRMYIQKCKNELNRR